MGCTGSRDEPIQLVGPNGEIGPRFRNQKELQKFYDQGISGKDIRKMKKRMDRAKRKAK